MAVAEKISPSAPVAQDGTDSDSSRHPEWLLVKRIVASPAFVRSSLLTKFLLYVCDRKLRGREDEITEHQIGVYALGRPGDYHPGEDNIVRNYARILRKRLEEYFDGHGRSEELRIYIPRGQYVPVFERAQPLVESPLAREEPAVPTEGLSQPTPLPLQPAPLVEDLPRAPANLSRRTFLLAASASGIVGLSALGWFGLHRKHVDVSAQIFETFWSQIFNQNRDCFVVTADSGLVLMERLTGRDVSLNEYVDGTLPTDLRRLSVTSSAGGGSVDAGTLHFTSTADLKVAIALDRIAMSVHATPKIRNARDMRLVEVKNSNGIFIGGPRANPWITLFEPRSNFQMKFYPAGGTEHGNQSIWNKSPKPGEQQEYFNATNTAPYTTYTMVSFLPSADDDGWVLILQGQNLSGTGAAGEFVTDTNAIAPVLKRAQKADGSIGPFELILETQVVGTDAPKARAVVERYQALNPS